MGKRRAAQKTAKKEKNNGNGANLGFEATLWAAVRNALLPRMPPSDLDAKA